MKINSKYVPASLSASDKKKQIKSIKSQTLRPRLKSFKSRRSKYVKEFEDKYETKITDHKFINRHIITQKGIDKILNKGRGAYYSSGSRPNQTPDSWANARLASVIVGGPARNIDMKIVKCHGRKKWLDTIGVSR